jgi:hypothetical protein
MTGTRIGLAIFLLAAATALAGDGAKRTPKEALQAFNTLIGSWRCTGMPEGTRAQKQKGFWTESMSWEWQFKKDDAWLNLSFDKGKHFRKGTLHYLPEKDQYRLTLQNTDKEAIDFEGALENRVLTLDRHDGKTKETQRLVITLLHEDRFLYRYEVKPADQPNFTRRYQVGATKEGVAFAGKGDNSPECIVSGGLGTIKMTYQGKDYYFCCTGCRDAFKDEPEKYIKEHEEKQKK